MPTLKGKSLGFLLVLILLVSLITPSGCAGKKEAVNGPREVLSFYLDALIGGRVDEACQNLSSGGKNSARIAAFAPGQSEEENFIRGQLAKKSTTSSKTSLSGKTTQRRLLRLRLPTMKR